MKNRGQMRKNKGFTLIEILVVIGIIAVLSGALMMGFGRVTRSAQRAKATELVSQAAQALVIMRQKNNNRWPSEIIGYGGVDGDGKGMVYEVAKKFGESKFSLLGIAMKNGEPTGISSCDTQFSSASRVPFEFASYQK